MNYLTQDGVDTLCENVIEKLNEKQDTLTPGTNITINNNVISSASESVEMTQAEYDALTNEEKNNGLIYYISDAGSSSPSSGGGANFTVDSQLSSTSENPVQNKVIYNALQNISGSDIIGCTDAFIDSLWT